MDFAFFAVILSFPSVSGGDVPHFLHSVLTDTVACVPLVDLSLRRSPSRLSSVVIIISGARFQRDISQRPRPARP